MTSTIRLSTNDINDLLCSGMDTETQVDDSAVPMFRAGCSVLSLGDLETLISESLDLEFELSAQKAA